MKKTIIAIKLRSTKKTKELGQLVLLLLGLGAVIGLVALLKWWLTR